MKSKEELNALKEEVEQLSKKLAELSDEELQQVAGGRGPDIDLEPDLEPPAHYYREYIPIYMSERPAL